MNYALEIRKSNIPVHLDIERDISLKKNGLFTFTIRVNNGNVCDYNVVEYVDASAYLRLKSVTFTQLASSCDHLKRSQVDTVRDTDV
jgi:hypothetical protein